MNIQLLSVRRPESVLCRFLALMFLFCRGATAAVLYVDVNSTNPIPPYTNWATAAAVIQDAVDATSAGDTVLVTNGMYSTGGRRPGLYDVTNRIAVTNGSIVKSVNGPLVTFIRGYQVPIGVSLTNAVRCVYLANSSLLGQLLFTNGGTLRMVTSQYLASNRSASTGRSTVARTVARSSSPW
jgi:hypothetical protein